MIPVTASHCNCCPYKANFIPRYAISKNLNDRKNCADLMFWASEKENHSI